MANLSKSHRFDAKYLKFDLKMSQNKSKLTKIVSYLKILNSYCSEMTLHYSGEV